MRCSQRTAHFGSGQTLHHTGNCTVHIVHAGQSMRGVLRGSEPVLVLVVIPERAKEDAFILEHEPLPVCVEKKPLHPVRAIFGLQPGPQMFQRELRPHARKKFFDFRLFVRGRARIGIGWSLAR